MRYVPSIPPATTSPDTHRVKGVSAVHAVKPVHAREEGVPYAELPKAHQAVPPAAELQQQAGAPVEDRRKAARRVSYQPMLVELRSGIERRRHTQGEDDGGEQHIDEIA